MDTRKSDILTLTPLRNNGTWPTANTERLNMWKARWRLFYGADPVKTYQVAFCRTCHKPHWIIGAQHKHLTVYCPGH